MKESPVLGVTLKPLCTPAEMWYVVPAGRAFISALMSCPGSTVTSVGEAATARSGEELVWMSAGPLTSEQPTAEIANTAARAAAGVGRMLSSFGVSPLG